ncbi:hypothetical protein L4D06_16575 [Enterovibrio makurazakiensis]|uniref:hypothetical protein n=1 Tax=Enterovibrio makurazakiensis TaxID=2910232 RepID=UPI003D214BF0
MKYFVAIILLFFPIAALAATCLDEGGISVDIGVTTVEDTSSIVKTGCTMVCTTFCDKDGNCTTVCTPQCWFGKIDNSSQGAGAPMCPRMMNPVDHLVYPIYFNEVAKRNSIGDSQR